MLQFQIYGYIIQHGLLKKCEKPINSEDLFIREGQHLSIKEISDKLFQNDYSGSSIATIYRRIKPELEKMGLKKDADGKYYYERNYESILNRSKIIEENELTGDEKIETLAIISNFLETIKDSPVYKKAQKYLKKEQEKIEAKRSDDKDQNYSRVIFMGAPEADIKQENWESIYRAMHSNTPIKLYYIPEGKKGKSIYRVQPYQLIFDNGCWDLWAECIDQGNRGKRLFNLSRICKMEVLERAEKFSLPSDYDFLRTMSGNFGCYNDWDLKRYKILFRKDSYAWLFSKDRIWGDNQSTEESDEGFIINFEATQFKPVLRWVLGWGDEVEPLEPPELVAEWKSKIKKMAEKL